MTSPDGVLEGVRVIELAQWMFVPAAGALLADLGADVIKIEEPIGGDPYRGLTTQGIPRTTNGVDLAVELANRGKRSISLDIKNEEGRRVLERLLQDADVLLTNIRPGGLDRLGLTAEAVAAINPRLIFARGHGVGVRGPDRDLASYDATAFWARSGFAHMLTAPSSEHAVWQRPALGDRTGSLGVALAVMGGLLQRERTGQGDVVDVSLMSTAIWVLGLDVVAAANGGEPVRIGRGPEGNPLIGTFRTRDDRYVLLCLLQPDRDWSDLCECIGREDLFADSAYGTLADRESNAERLVAELAETFSQRDLDFWSQRLASFLGPWSPAQTISELVEDPQVVANEYVADVDTERGFNVRLPTAPIQFGERAVTAGRAPEFGEHTELVLLEHGFSWDDIAALRDGGAIA